jgi:hypothetical protein
MNDGLIVRHSRWIWFVNGCGVLTFLVFIQRASLMTQYSTKVSVEVEGMSWVDARFCISRTNKFNG